MTAQYDATVYRPTRQASPAPVQPVKPQPVMMTPDEVAKQLHVSRMTVYRLIHEQILPAFQIGRSFRINPRDLTHYMRGASTVLGNEEQ